MHLVTMRWVSVVLCVGACAVSCGRLAPPLPTVNLDAFGPAPRQAIAEALAQAQAHADNAAAVGRLGMLLHAHDQFAVAASAYARAEALDPRRVAWPYYRADVAGKLGKHEEALAAVNRALAIDPRDRPSLVRRADLLWQTGRLEASEAAYRKLLGDQPRDAILLHGLGRVLSARGKAVDALTTLESACAAAPEFGAAHFTLANELRKAGRLDQAAHHMRMAQFHERSAPQVNDPLMAEIGELSQSAARYLRAGARLDREGKIEEAIEAHRRALAIDPDSAQAHSNLISLYARAGKPSLAEEAYRAALATGSGLADVHYNYGILCFQSGRRSEAVAAFEKALTSNPQHSGAHTNLGFLFMERGDGTAAMRHFEQALAVDRTNRLAHFHLGRILANQRQYAKAIAHFEQTLTPEDEATPGYLYALGIAQGRAGDPAAAAVSLKRARALAGRLGQAPLSAMIERDLRQLGAQGAR